MSTRYFAGCDVGSTTGKAVIMNDKKIVATAIVESEIDPEKTAINALIKAMESVKDLKRIEDISCLVGTGYGRTEVPFAQKNVSEISCHALGAFYVDKKIRTIVDIGGQDIKGISLNDNGSVKEFAMNDKCAAGTGKFFEAMGRTFKMNLTEFATLAGKAKRSISVTSQCSVFAESEVISLISKKNPPEEIALGIHEAVGKRCYTLLKRVGLNPKITITGGCAKNKTLVKALREILKMPIAELELDPQLMGALGACVFARQSANWP